MTGLLDRGSDRLMSGIMTFGSASLTRMILYCIIKLSFI